MNILFKENATLGQKIQIIFFLMVLITALFGIFSNMLVNESILIYEYSNYIALVTVLIFLISLFKPNSTLKKRLEEQKKSIVLSTIIMICFIPLITKLTCERGIPIILHTFTKKPSEMKVVVSKQESSKHCRKGVELFGYERLGNGKVCGLGDKFLSFAKSGTKFTLIGEESIFGFTTDRYRYKEPTEHSLELKR